MQTTNKQSITIDIRKRTLSTQFAVNQSAIPQFVQGDTNILEVTVLDGGRPADLSNVGRVVTNFKRSKDKHITSRLATIQGNVVTYQIGQEEMMRDGSAEVEMQFYNADDTQRLSTLRFKVHVTAQIGSDEVIGNDPEYTILQELFIETSAITEDAATKAEYAKEQGDYAKEAAETTVTNWLSPVSNYTAVQGISNPNLGDTVQTLDNGYVYRYENGSWNYTQGYGATALANVNAQLAEISQQKADLSYVDTKIGTIGNTKTFKGSVAFASLPTSGNVNGDYYYVTDKTTNYCWNGTSWVDIGNNVSVGEGTITYPNLSSDVVTVSKSSNILDLSAYSEFNISSGGAPTYVAGNYGYKLPITNGKRYGLFRKDGNGNIIAWLPRVSITDENNNVLAYYIGTSSDITISNVSAKYMWIWNAGWTLANYDTYKVMTIEDYNGTPPTSYIAYFKKYSLKGVPSKVSEITDDVGIVVLDWKGKTQSTYGDSITASNNGYGGQPMSPDYEYMWGGYVHNYFKMGSFYGRGIGSSTFCWNTQTWFANADGSYNNRPPAAQPAGTTVHKGPFCSWDRIKTMYPDSIRYNINLILIMGGTNDFGVNNPLGSNPVWSASNTTDSDWVADTTFYNGGDYDISNFKGAVASTVMKLQARCPNAIVVLMTQLSGQGGNTSKNPLVNTLSLKPIDYAKALKETAQFMSVPCIDVFANTGINQINSTTYITDGTHPSTIVGQKALARAVIGGLKGILPNI